MKLWFAKVRISAALDAGKQPSVWWRRRVSGSEDLRGFEREITALDHTLRRTAPRPKGPASLHRSIMQAVRESDRPAAARREPGILRWAPVPVFALIAMFGVWWVLHSAVEQPTQNAQSLSAVTTALDMGSQVVRTVPSAVVSPLSDELERLNRDLDSTAQFLLSSLP